MSSSIQNLVDAEHSSGALESKQIKRLSTLVADQIAAGEVIERPASVVKELLENSLDAGATRIRIWIERGGVTLIKLQDNGVGIRKSELKLALARHATSKLSKPADLKAIASLGFRGEALASIVSVAKVTLASKHRDEMVSWQIQTAGDTLLKDYQAAHLEAGTSITIEDLFFNMPARKQFLRAERTETYHIEQLLRRYAACYRHVQFCGYLNGKLWFDWPANKTPIEAKLNEKPDPHALIPQDVARIRQLFGRGFISASKHIVRKYGDWVLTGWVTASDYHRASNDQQFFFVNQRLVQDKMIRHALSQAFNRFLPEGRFAAYCLFFECPFDALDVNVHPTKHEVRFVESRLVHDFIVSTLQAAITSVNEQASTDRSLQSIEASQKRFERPAPTKQPSAFETIWQTENKPVNQTPAHAIGRREISNADIPSMRGTAVDESCHEKALSVDETNSFQKVLSDDESIEQKISKSTASESTLPSGNVHASANALPSRLNLGQSENSTQDREAKQPIKDTQNISGFDESPELHTLSEAQQPKAPINHTEANASVRNPGKSETHYVLTANAVLYNRYVICTKTMTKFGEGDPSVKIKHGILDWQALVILRLKEGLDQFKNASKPIATKPLLLPVKVSVSNKLFKSLKKQSKEWSKMGVHFNVLTEHAKNICILREVPRVLMTTTVSKEHLDRLIQTTPGSSACLKALALAECDSTTISIESVQAQLRKLKPQLEEHLERAPVFQTLKRRDLQKWFE